ncbi:MAG: glycosyltransferase [Pseudomonadota bacterium]
MTGSGVTPLVAVIVPVRDRIELLRETVNSLRSQTLDRWEAVLVDDGTRAEARSDLELMVRADPRIRLLERPAIRPAGASACRNTGVAAARASIIVFLDSDDLLAPEALADRVAWLQGNPHAEVLVRQGQVFERVTGDLGDLPWNELDTGEDLLTRFLAADTPWQTTGPTWRRSALERVGPWDEQATSWQDWEFHVRALAAGVTFFLDPTVDHHHRRRHGASMRARHDAPEALVTRAATFSRVLCRLDSAAMRTRRRDELLAGLYLRFALKAARLHGPHDAGVAARAVLEALLKTGLLRAGELAPARALVRDASRGVIDGERDAAAIADYPVLAEVCASPGRRRARGQVVGPTNPP